MKKLANSSGTKDCSDQLISRLLQDISRQFTLPQKYTCLLQAPYTILRQYSFLYPLKTSAYQRFSYVFRAYRNGALAWNGLKALIRVLRCHKVTSNKWRIMFFEDIGTGDKWNIFDCLFCQGSSDHLQNAPYT